MPYRHAHWYLLLLFPLVGLAFWRGYLSVLPTSPAAFHVHGITASLWILLLALQSWSIHRRRNALHRAVGIASFALFPLFVTGGLLVIQTMAVKFGARDGPFYSAFGARLGLIDTLSSIAIPLMFYMALKWRRKVHLHARYMLAPALFLLGPILSRLAPAFPPLAISGPQDMYHFGYGFHLAGLIAIAFASILWLRAPKHGRPFLIVGGLVALQMFLFEYVGRTAAWERLFTALASVPASAIVSIGLAASVAAIWTGWIAGQNPPRALATA
jgi:hypothetical protein